MAPACIDEGPLGHGLRQSTAPFVKTIAPYLGETRLAAESIDPDEIRLCPKRPKACLFQPFPERQELMEVEVVAPEVDLDLELAKRQGRVRFAPGGMRVKEGVEEIKLGALDVDFEDVDERVACKSRKGTKSAWDATPPALFFGVEKRVFLVKMTNRSSSSTRRGCASPDAASHRRHPRSCTAGNESGDPRLGSRGVRGPTGSPSSRIRTPGSCPWRRGTRPRMTTRPTRQRSKSRIRRRGRGLGRLGGSRRRTCPRLRGCRRA